MPNDEAPAPPSRPAPDLKVVDRRWWARGSETAPAGEATSLKPTYVEQLEQQLADKDRQLQDAIGKYRAASSEFEQARARMRREVLKDAERGRRSIFEALLEVIDNFDRALEAGRASIEDSPLLNGVEMVRRQLLSTLQSFGVTRIDALGQRFDPARHEAITNVPTDTPEEDGTVVGVMAPGYAIGDDVLRPARVAVGQKNPA